MTREELMDAFSFEGIQPHNAMVNFTEEDPFDPEGGVAECGTYPHAARGGAGAADCCRLLAQPDCVRIQARCCGWLR